MCSGVVALSEIHIPSRGCLTENKKKVALWKNVLSTFLPRVTREDWYNFHSVRNSRWAEGYVILCFKPFFYYLKLLVSRQLLSYSRQIDNNGVVNLSRSFEMFFFCISNGHLHLTAFGLLLVVIDIQNFWAHKSLSGRVKLFPYGKKC